MVHMKNVIQNKKTALYRLSTDGWVGEKSYTKSRADSWESTGLLLQGTQGRIHRKNLNRLLFILLMGKLETHENKKT